MRYDGPLGQRDFETRYTVRFDAIGDTERRFVHVVRCAEGMEQPQARRPNLVRSIVRRVPGPLYRVPYVIRWDDPQGGLEGRYPLLLWLLLLWLLLLLWFLFVLLFVVVVIGWK